VKAKKKKQLRFGGPGLPEGTHTWIRDKEKPLPTPDGEPQRYGKLSPVKPGALLDYDRVVDPESYVKKQMAEVVEEAPPAPAVATEKED
jgi:hypothetical protein